MHGVFDIVGPIMIGPSSSHTAGAARLGLIAGKILGEPPVRADIKLHGSFAHTYHGHGTDKALVGGIMGFEPDDERIRDALKIAPKRGLDVHFETVELGDAHPNTAVISLIGEKGAVAKVQGASVGGGNILITNIDGYEVELTGQYPALIIVQHDRPGVVSQVSNILAKYSINIAFMRVSRQNRGETAMMIMETDDYLSDDVLEECRQVYDVKAAFSIPAI